MSDQHEDNDYRLTLIDTSKGLTVEELTELKQLASLSKTAKLIVGIGFGILTIFGVPDILAWLGKHFH